MVASWEGATLSEDGRTPLLGGPEGSATRAGRDANNAFGQARRAEAVGYNAQISATEALQVARFGAVEARRVTVGDFQNLVKNGSFLDLDDDDALTLAPWWAHDGEGRGTWSAVTAAGRTGPVAARYDPAGQTETAELWANVGTADGFDADRGAPAVVSERYQGSVYVRRGETAAGNVRLALQGRDVNGDALDTWYSDYEAPTTTWVRRTLLTPPVPEGTVTIHLLVQVASGSAGTVDVDDALLRRAIPADLLVSGTIVSGEGIQSFEYDGDGTSSDPGTKGWFLGGDGQLHAQEARLRGNLTSEDVYSDGAYVGTVSAGQLGMNWRRTNGLVIPGGSVRTSILDPNPALAAGDCGMGLYGGMNLALELFDNNKHFAYGDWAFNGQTNLLRSSGPQLKVTSFGTGNCYLAFYRGNGSRTGYIGNGIGANNNMVISGDGNDIQMLNNLQLPAGTAGSPSLRFAGDTNSGIYSSTSNAIGFSTNGTFVARFLGATFYVGTTTTNPTNITGGSANGFTVAGASHYMAVSRSGSPTAYFNRNTSNGDLIVFRRAGTTRGSISITTSATTYNTTSDYRLKENLRPIETPLVLLGRLNPITFDWRGHPEEGEAQGFLAHEVAEVVPQAVQGEKDAEEMQQLDHSKLVPLLVAAVQELTAKVADLEARLT